jgi:hypothetical protein
MPNAWNTAAFRRLASALRFVRTQVQKDGSAWRVIFTRGASMIAGVMAVEPSSSKGIEPAGSLIQGR